MMKLLVRGIIFVLVALLFVVVYFGVFQKDVSKLEKIRPTVMNMDEVIANSISKLKPEVVNQINAEWDEFLKFKIIKATTRKPKVKTTLNIEKQPNTVSPTKNIEKLSTEYLLTFHTTEADNLVNNKKLESITDTQKPKIRIINDAKIVRDLPKGESEKKWLILIYTKLHKVKEWPNLKREGIEHYFENITCKSRNCQVTYDRRLFKQADAVVFHERNMPSPDTFEQLNRERFAQQRWIFFTSETPKNSDTNILPYNGYFNWTMTYKADSDIFLPYLQYRKLAPGDPRPPAHFNYAETKSRPTAWLVGNCKFFFRMEYAKLLQEYTDVHVGGGCRDNFKLKVNCTRWCPLERLQPYKFYLSFENGVCTDYISEKYWRYLELKLVPVVLSGADYSNPKIAIPGSYIDASKYTSAKHLGAYLNYLDKNDTAYNEYFSWRQKYKIWHPPQGDWPFESYFLCKICEMLNADLPAKTYYSLSEFWNEYTDCELPEKRLMKSMFPDNYDWSDPHREKDEKERVQKAVIKKTFDDDS